MNRLIIIGSGGHASVLLDILKNNNKIVGYADKKPSESFSDIHYIGTDEEVILKYSPSSIKIVNGLGSIEKLDKRKNIFNFYKSKGFEFYSVIHPTAIISPKATLLEGVQLLAGTIIQCNSFVGSNSIINSGSIIEHDTYIGESVHVSPRVVIGGNCKIENYSHVGIGTTIIQGIKVGSYSCIGAGSVVIHDVAENTKVMGIPAKKRGE